MQSRVQLALALILLLVLTPLAGATCGIECMAATPLHLTHSVAAQHPCVRASTCCHSSSPALCNATSASDIAVALATDTRVPHDTTANATIAAASLPQNSRASAVRGMDSSPPGQLLSATSIPLRV